MKKLIISLCALSMVMFSMPVFAEENSEEILTTDSIEAITEFEDTTESFESETDTTAAVTTVSSGNVLTQMTTVIDNIDEEENYGTIVRRFEKVNGETSVKDKEIVFKGDKKVNVFELNAEDVTSTDYIFNYEIPEYSYAIIRIGGESVSAYTQEGILYNGSVIDEDISSHILFYFYEAKNITLYGEKAVYGSIYAPDADIITDENEIYVTGNVIAKTLDTRIKTGESRFKLKLNNNVSTSISTANTTNTTVTLVASPKTGRDSSGMGMNNNAIAYPFFIIAIAIIAISIINGIRKSNTRR